MHSWYSTGPVSLRLVLPLLSQERGLRGDMNLRSPVPQHGSLHSRCSTHTHTQDWTASVQREKSAENQLVLGGGVLWERRCQKGHTRRAAMDLKPSGKMLGLREESCSCAGQASAAVEPRMNTARAHFLGSLWSILCPLKLLIRPTIFRVLYFPAAVLKSQHSIKHANAALGLCVSISHCLWFSTTPQHNRVPFIKPKLRASLPFDVKLMVCFWVYGAVTAPASYSTLAYCMALLSRGF